MRSYKKILEKHNHLDSINKTKIKNRIKTIYSLLKYFIENNEKLFKTLKDKNSCSICLSNIGKKNMSFTLCCHVFCFTCIIQHLEHKQNCPLCRRKLFNQFVFRYNKDEKIYNTYLEKYGSKIKYLEALLDFWRKNDIYKDIVLFCFHKKTKKIVYKLLKNKKFTIYKKTDIKTNDTKPNIYLIDSKELLEKNLTLLCKYKCPIVVLDEKLPQNIEKDIEYKFLKKSIIYHLSYQ